MPEYIERDAAISALIKAPKHYGFSEEGRKLTDMYDALVHIPAADVRPVVRGCKESVGFDEVYTEFFACSKCGEDRLFKDSNFCPNCGADCRGGEVVHE